MELTLQQAADQLDVSTRQAQRLASAGVLHVTRKVGRSSLVDSDSVVSASRTARGPGRRYDVRTAWAAVDLLESGGTDRVTGSQLSRLRRRLRELEPDELVIGLSRRAHVHRLTRTRGTPSSLSADVSPSGRSMLHQQLSYLDGRRGKEVVGRRLGLTTAGPSPERLEGYVESAAFDDLSHRHGLVPDADGDVVLHVSDLSPTTGWVTTALDLAERGSAREAAAAAALLQDLLRRFRDTPPVGS